MLTRLRPALFLALVLPLLLMAGCQKNPLDPNQNNPNNPFFEGGVFELNIEPYVSGREFYMDEQFLTEPIYDVRNIFGDTVRGARRFNVTLLKLYVSNLRLVRMDGTDTLLKAVHLFDFSENSATREEGFDKTAHGRGEYLQIEVPPGEWMGVRFGVGVVDTLNATRPAEYDADHPLSAFQSTYWDWKTGYRFMMFEGLIDTNSLPDSVPDMPFTYHPGTDPLYVELDYTHSRHRFQTLKDYETRFTVELDLNALFTAQDTLNIIDHPFSHTAGPDTWIAELIMRNLEASLFAPQPELFYAP